jgi:erythromycin esterase-like protein
MTGLRGSIEQLHVADQTGRIAAMIARDAEPLPDIDDPAFGRMFDRFADARLVLLGEASHGTSEFYRARAAITRRLIEAHGFNLVAVEADWPDAATIDRHVRHKAARTDGEPPFTRFPTWMWRNTEFDGFVRWLRRHNQALAPEARVSFHGLDLYNLNASIRAVVDYLDTVDPDAAATARQRYGCLKPWREDPAVYGRIAMREGHARCEAGVVATLRDLFARQLEYAAAAGGDDFMDAAQNARLVANAEAYYRAMYYGSAASWNLRDEHMFDTLDLLMRSKGPQAKAVVWAHNSHIGDARFTDMGESRDELNLGQLARENYGEDVRLIGFGTHTGTVAAADDWDAPMKIKRINPSRPDSYERLAHDSGVERFLLDLREGVHDPLRDELMEQRLERFIGVIYRPDTERWSHYSSASLPAQFDAFVWFDTTSAVTALPAPDGARRADHAQADDTYPFGV